MDPVSTIHMCNIFWTIKMFMGVLSSVWIIFLFITHHLSWLDVHAFVKTFVKYVFNELWNCELLMHAQTKPEWGRSRFYGSVLFHGGRGYSVYLQNNHKDNDRVRCGSDSNLDIPPSSFNFECVDEVQQH